MPPELLQFTDPRGWSSSEGPGSSLIVFYGTGGITLALLVLVSVWVTVREGLRSTFRSICCCFSTSLFVRLFLLESVLLVPLFFYINLHEPFNVAKRTGLEVLALCGLASWLAVCGHIPRYRTPYAWPVALLLLASCLSLFVAVNMGAGLSALHYLSGCLVLLFLTIQVITTTKRLHLLLTGILLSSLAVAFYGLAQNHYLLPREWIFTMGIPYSTLGYFPELGYYLNLVWPLSLVLVLRSSGPITTLLAFGVYYILRWQYMSFVPPSSFLAWVGGWLVAVLAALYTERRVLRLLLLVILLEPLLWGAQSIAKLQTFNDLFAWSNSLSGPQYRGLMVQSLDAVDHLQVPNLKEHLLTAFVNGLEGFLALKTRFCALLVGLLIPLLLFGLVARWTRRLMLLLPLACVLALIPYGLMMATWPSDQSPQEISRIVKEQIEAGDGPNKEVILLGIDQYGTDIAEAAQPYINLVLWKHRAVGAMASLSLFVAMMSFLFWKALERARFLTLLIMIVVTGCGFLGYLGLLRTTEPWVDFMKAALETSTPYLWPFPMDALPMRFPALDRLMTCGGLASVSLLALACLAWGSCKDRDALSRSPGQRILKILISTGVVLCFVLAWQLPNPEPGEPIGSLTLTVEDRLSAMRTMRANPIFGTGAGNYQIVHPVYASDLENHLLGKEVTTRYVMSDLLQTAVETGPLGLLGLIWILILTLRSLGWMVMDSSSHPLPGAMVFPMVWSLGSLVFQVFLGISLLCPASGLLGWILIGIAANLPILKSSPLLPCVNQKDSGMLVETDRSVGEIEVDTTGPHKWEYCRDPSDHTCNTEPE